MRNKKLSNIDEKTFDMIIAAAYKDAGLRDRIKVYFLVNKNPEAKRLYNEYRSTSDKVKRIPLDECPESITESLNIKTERKNKPLILKPAYIFAIAVIIVSTIVAILLNQNNGKEPVYTKAEIEQAEQQVKTSLAIVNRVFKKTEDLIEKDILPKRVARPLNKSLSIINEVLIGG